MVRPFAPGSVAFINTVDAEVDTSFSYPFEAIELICLRKGFTVHFMDSESAETALNYFSIF